MHAPPSTAGQPELQITAPHRGKEGKAPRTCFAAAEAGDEKKKCIVKVDVHATD